MNFRSQFRLRPFTWMLLSVLAILLTLMAIGCFIIGSPRYKGLPSDHFDGKRFFNPIASGRRGFPDMLKWLWSRKPGPWLPFQMHPYGPPPPERVGKGKLRITPINHSTVLIQMDGLNMLTDPVWSERIGPVSWAGPKRHVNPGLSLEELPPIDVVLLSHNHYEHIDLPTLKEIVSRHTPKIFTGLGNNALLTRAGITASTEMDWWDEAKLSHNVGIAFVPARHFSSRGLCDRNRTLWGGFVILGPAGPVYFAGDTGMGPHFEEIVERYGKPRLALLPIGAFLPRWFMAPMHLSPEQAVAVHHLMQARTSVPIHYGTFKLGDDGQFEGVERLLQEVMRTGTPPASFPVIPFGTGFDVP